LKNFILVILFSIVAQNADLGIYMVHSKIQIRDVFI
jgi:hypothetical protein